MAVCPACRSECADQAKFCGRCGTSLKRSCPACNSPYDEGQCFCEECGAALGFRPPDQDPTQGPPRSPTPPAAGLAAELRVVSVLFVDLVGFTSLAEGRAPEDLRELLGRYFAATRAIVEHHGGRIEKFVGDAVMAVWGAPAAREDDAERAVRAALATVAAVSEFGGELGLPGLRARAGVATGQALALENPDEGIVVGDRVNTAARVQAVAEPGTVFVDDVTRQVTSPFIAYVPAGGHVVKGKALPLRLWRAVDVEDVPDRERGQDPPFVGREAELWLMKELFHGALERRSARLLALTVEVGTGKSRLAREFFRYVDSLSEPVLWHLGRCPAFSDGIAYWALAEMVRQRLGIAEDASAEEAAARLDEGLVRWAPDAADRAFLRPRLGALLATEEPNLSRADLFAGWRQFFERLSAQLPVVLVFEDFQFADQGLLEFIDELLDWSSACPIFLVTLARPNASDGDDGWPAGRRGAIARRLEPFDATTMRELLDGLVDGLSDDHAGRIVERSEGTPLYAIELVRALSERGVLRDQGGRIVLAGELGELDVPATLTSLLAARLDALTAVERGFVKAMSLFGGSFSRATAQALGGVEPDHLDAVLASLVRQHVLTIRTDRFSPQRGQYGFAQGLLRSVAYDTLSRQERMVRHVAAAEHLRASFPNDGEDVAEAIAAHYAEAYRAAGSDPEADGLRGLALDALRRAARRAAVVGAPDAAERFYLTAAELAATAGEREQLREEAGLMACQSGRYEQAVELLEEARSRLLASGEQRKAARVESDIGYALTRMGRLREAVEHHRAALAVLAAHGPDPDVAELNARLARALIFLGDYEGAGPPLENALAIAEALDLTAILADALTLKAITFRHTGWVRQARSLWIGAIELVAQEELGPELAAAATGLGNLAVLWDLPDAIERTESGLAIARRQGVRLLESLNGANLMMVHVLRGEWTEAEELAVELLAGDGERPGAQAVHFVEAILCLLRGQLPAARGVFERMAATPTENEERRACLAAIELSLLLAEGDPESALARGEAFLPRAIEIVGVDHESVRQAWPETLHAALALGATASAGRVLALVADRPPGMIPPYLGAHLARAGALVHAIAHLDETVERDLRAAVDDFRDLGYPYWVAIGETDLAAWLERHGRAEEAATLRNRAAAAHTALGAPVAQDRLADAAFTLPGD